MAIAVVKFPKPVGTPATQFVQTLYEGSQQYEWRHPLDQESRAQSATYVASGGPFLSPMSDGVRMLFGAPAADTVGGNSLAGFVCSAKVTPDITTESETLLEGTAAQERLGTSIALSQKKNRILVGCPGDYSNATAGKVHICEVTSGGVVSILATINSPVSGDTGRKFGYAVAISRSGTVAAISAPLDVTTTPTIGSAGGTGRVFIYSISNDATPVATLTDVIGPGEGPTLAISTNASYGFGGALSMSHETIPSLLIGYRSNDAYYGSAWLYRSGGGSWTLFKKFTRADGGYANNLGMSVGLSPNGKQVILGNQTIMATMWELVDGVWVSSITDPGEASEGNYGVFATTDAIVVTGDTPGTDRATTRVWRRLSNGAWYEAMQIDLAVVRWDGCNSKLQYVNGELYLFMLAWERDGEAPNNVTNVGTVLRYKIGRPAGPVTL